jgi:hypothetical protein
MSKYKVELVRELNLSNTFEQTKDCIRHYRITYGHDDWSFTFKKYYLSDCAGYCELTGADCVMPVALKVVDDKGNEITTLFVHENLVKYSVGKDRIQYHCATVNVREFISIVMNAVW